VSAVASVLVFLLYAFLVLLFFRLIMEYVFMFARSFRPSGFLAVVLELCYTVTDPPLRALRRVIPPLRVGGVSLDLGFMVLVILVYVLISVVGPLG
jgi:YggT family protein